MKSRFRRDDMKLQFSHQLQAVRGCIEFADGSLLTGRQFRMQTHRAPARDRVSVAYDVRLVA